MRVQSSSESETEKLARDLAERLVKEPKAFVRLQGELGAGKSTFARGFIKRWLELTGDDPSGFVPSPTYNIARQYGTKRPLSHLDLYRMSSLEELEQIGYESYFYDSDATLVEWLEMIPGGERLMPRSAVTVRITITGTAREVEITP